VPFLCWSLKRISSIVATLNVHRVETENGWDQAIINEVRRPRMALHADLADLEDLHIHQ